MIDIKMFFSHTITTLLLGVLTICAIIYSNLKYFHPYFWSEGWKLFFDWIVISFQPTPTSKVEKSIQSYAEKCGCNCDVYEAITKDGFVLIIQNIYPSKITQQEKNQRTAVILQHGLLQNSEVFVTNEEHSLAFYLANLGYDVWLGNNRGNSRHVDLEDSCEEYWDWSLDDLAKFDFPTIVEFVISKISHSRVVYVGHSQGYAQAFAGVCLNPQLASKLKLLVGLAPPVFVRSPSNFALNWMKSASSDTYFGFFGKTMFIPALKWIQNILPANVFCILAYGMFNYLFDWGDSQWNKSRKFKYFQCTPTLTSSKLIFHWFKILKAGQLVGFSDSKEDEQCYSPDNEIVCPIALFYGDKDSVVDADRLLASSSKHNIQAAIKFEGFEHMDLIWAKNAHEKVYPHLHHVIQSAVVQSM